ncbi:protein-tyrosine phosphatase-like protein [Phlyctochytrium arcticum]|nr:protein-tyrosine phosphatase-like protein [Phlyctochytrium arcticum]
MSSIGPAPSSAPTIHGSDAVEPRLPSDRLSENGFTTVANFRDVGRNFNIDNEAGTKCGRAAIPPLKEGNFFRSARLDDASSSDVQTLQDRYGIKTIIDLRSELERRECDHVSSTFLFSAIEEELNPASHFTSSSTSSTQPEQEEHQHQSETSSTTTTTRRKRFSIEFAGPEFRNNAVWKPLDWLTKLKVIGYMATYQKPSAIQLIGTQIISPRGLKGLNRDFVDYCSTEIVQALKILSNPGNYPCLVHCTQGKDRTGIVVALALTCARVPKCHILQDYIRSQDGLTSQRDTMVAEMAKAGLDPGFSDAPESVLRDTLGYLEDRYGSVDEYLEQKGFTKVWRERLRGCLVGDQPADGSADGSSI